MRIAQQRALLGQDAQALESLLGKGDTVLRGIDWLKARPWAVGAAVAGAVAVRPRRAWRWAQRGFFLWRGWRTLTQSLSGLR